MYEYRAQVTRVVDADTLDLHIDLGFYMYARIRVRLAGIDAWEVRGPEREEGLIAKSAVSSLLPTGAFVTVRTSKAGKYGRWLAEIFLEGDDGPYSLNQWLLDNGHATPYT